MSAISVIVPVYNVEMYIERCVDSILGQTYTDFELILVDDGSPDNCPAICDKYAKKDSRIHVIHQENGGLSAARNTGIDWAFANSDSQWLTFIDSDDWVDLEYLERLYQANEVFQTKICICKIATDEAPIMQADLLPLKYLTEDAYCSENLGVSMISSCGKLYQKSLWEYIRFPQGKLHEDRFTTHKVLFQSPNVTIIQAPLYRYYINPNGITHSPWQSKRTDDIEALMQQCDFFKDIHALHAWKKTALSSMWLITSMIQEIDKKEKITYEDLKCKRELLKKLRESIKNCKKITNISIDNYCYAYETAYPRLIRLYWYGCALMRKLKLMK